MGDWRDGLKFLEPLEMDNLRSLSFGPTHSQKHPYSFTSIFVGAIAIPDVSSFNLTERDHFIILRCDGLWGVFGPSDAVDFVCKLLKEGLPVTAISRRLVREAVRERWCKVTPLQLLLFLSSCN